METDTPLAESPLAKALRTYSSGTAGDAIDTQDAKRLGLIGGGDLTTLDTATLAALEALSGGGDGNGA